MTPIDSIAGVRQILIMQARVLVILIDLNYHGLLLWVPAVLGNVWRCYADDLAILNGKRGLVLVQLPKLVIFFQILRLLDKEIDRRR